MQKLPAQVGEDNVHKLQYHSIYEVKVNRMYRVYKNRIADICQAAGYRLVAAAANYN